MRSFIASTAHAIAKTMAKHPINPTSTISDKKKVFILLPSISERAADWLYWSGNLLVLLAAILGIAGACGVLWGDRVRDYFSDKRISDNELKTAVANQRAAEADERAAEANANTAKIYERIKWRHIDPQKIGLFDSAFSVLKANNIHIMEPYYSVNDPEAESLAKEIEGVVRRYQRESLWDDPQFKPSMARSKPGGPTGPVIPIGVWVIYGSGNLSRGVGALVGALYSAGITVQTLDMGANPESSFSQNVLIEVGYNPTFAEEPKLDESSGHP